MQRLRTGLKRIMPIHIKDERIMTWCIIHDIIHLNIRFSTHENILINLLKFVNRKEHNWPSGHIDVQRTSPGRPFWTRGRPNRTSFERTKWSQTRPSHMDNNGCPFWMSGGRLLDVYFSQRMSNGRAWDVPKASIIIWVIVIITSIIEKKKAI